MFKGLGNLGNIASMVGAFQKLPEKMQELNEQMKSETVSGSDANGVVTVMMNGVGQVQSVQITTELPTTEMESAVLEATNAAGATAKQLYAERISQMVSDMDLNIPGVEGMISSMTGGA